MLTKRNKKWYFQTKIHGRTWMRTTGQSDKRKALEQVPALRHQAQLRRQLSTTSPRCSLHQAIVDEVQRVEMDVGTQRAQRVRYALKGFAKFVGRDLPLERLPADTLTQFQRFRLPRAARSTVQAEVWTILRMLRGRLHNVQKPPSIGHGAFHPNRGFTDPELRAIFAAATPHYRDLYLVLLTTGARLAEVVPSKRSRHTALLESEVDYTAGTVTIRNAKQKPGAAQSEPRTVSVPRETLDALRRSSTDTFGPHVFGPAANAARDFQRCLQRAGVVRVNALGRRATLHSFRHTYGTKVAAMVGQNTFILKEILGHKKLSTTEQYCHPAAPAIILNVAFLMERDTPGLQTGLQGGEQEEKASA